MGKSGPWSRENTKLVYKHMEIHVGTPKTTRELSGLAPKNVHAMQILYFWAESLHVMFPNHILVQQRKSKSRVYTKHWD